MPNDYISRETAIEVLCGHCQDIDYGEDEDTCWCMKKDRLNQIPAADVAEIVRCKNCAEYDPDAEWCNVWQYYLQPDFFCACGKRRADDG